MNKKYILVIPEMIRSDDCKIANDLFCFNNKEISTRTDANGEYVTSKLGFSIPIENIPKEWLKEIKQPVRFDDVFCSELKIAQNQAEYSLYKKHFEFYWKAAIENERLKHAPKKNFCDLAIEFNRSQLYSSDDMFIFRCGLEFAEKNRGF